MLQRREIMPIQVEGVGKCYHLFETPLQQIRHALFPFGAKAPGEFWALRNISFEIKRGETFGIVGRNGSGKSTLLQLIAGTLTPTEGTIAVNGRIAALLELGSGFNPHFTGLENIYLNGAILGLGRTEIERRLDDILSFADIGNFIQQPVKTYSSGMFVRLAFAVQICLDPDIMIVDEALAVGDIFFRQKCYARLDKLRKNGTTVLLVTHAMAEIEQLCERAIVLHEGAQKFLGPASEATKRYYMLNNNLDKSQDVIVNVDLCNSDASSSTSSILNSIIGVADCKQVSNGDAECIGYITTNMNDQPCNSFKQGDWVKFYYRFDVFADIGIPIYGVVIFNDHKVHVYGKCNWQVDDDTKAVKSGTKILCCQQVKLDLAPGDYVFEVGLASVSRDIWANRKNISHEEFASLHQRVCIVPEIGSFTIGLPTVNNVSMLTHYGIANLQSKFSIDLEI